MKFEGKSSRLAEYLGFIAAYFLFTTALYFILTYLKKLPCCWNYLYFMLLTIGITAIGLLIKRLLK